MEKRKEERKGNKKEKDKIDFLLFFLDKLKIQL